MEFCRADLIWKGESAITEILCFPTSTTVDNLLFTVESTLHPGAAASAIHQQGESPAVLVHIVGCEQNSDGVLLLG
jgi:hypothetical protein